ncbi:hypothetical protein, partial [Streptomyces sp. AC627_RSS907]
MVRDETARHPDLAGILHGLVETAGPLTERVTGLQLCHPPRFRILTPSWWRAEVRQHLAQVDARDLAEHPPARSVATIWLRHVGRRGWLRWSWLLTPATTITNTAGFSETLITPEALRHAGLLADEEALGTLVARELAHRLRLAHIAGD